MQTVEDLGKLAREVGVEIAQTVSFSDDVGHAVGQLKKLDARIIVGLFYDKMARQVMCQVRRASSLELLHSLHSLLSCRVVLNGKDRRADTYAVILLLLLLTLFARARVRCSGIPPEAVRAALRLVADRLVRGQLVRAARERLYGGADARGGQLALHDRKPRAQPARQQRDVGPPRAPLSIAYHPISHTIPTTLHSSSASVSLPLNVHSITSRPHSRLILHATFCVLRAELPEFQSKAARQAPRTLPEEL